jgi:photosystem II stability/assembly factor-like uncharacterized protein
MLARMLILLIITLLSTVIYSDWSTYTFPLPWSIQAIEIRNRAYGWLIGVQGNQIAKWDGLSWQQSPVTGVSFMPEDISATNDSNAWAVGDDGAILHYETDHWTAYPSPTTQNLYDVYMINATDGWAVGLNVLLHYTGGVWTVYNKTRYSGT